MYSKIDQALIALIIEAIKDPNFAKVALSIVAISVIGWITITCLKAVW